jgi:acyl phosphate:glycerol-3-phosphate acyltransferase
MLLNFISVVLAYLIGSIPFAYIVARISRKIDIRDVDNGNVGAGAIIRAVGVRQGILVLILDAGKGALSLFIARLLGVPDIWLYAAGAAVVIGHCFPLYIGFRGGQGVAATIGIFLYVTPLATLCVLGIIFIVLAAQYRVWPQRIFLAVLAGSPTLPLFIWLIYQGSPKVLELIIFSAVIIVFIILKNVTRLRSRRAIMTSHRQGKGADKK